MKGHLDDWLSALSLPVCTPQQRSLYRHPQAVAHAPQSGRDKGAVKGHLDDWLVADDVVASSAQTMEDTLRYLDSRYGGAHSAWFTNSWFIYSKDGISFCKARWRHAALPRLPLRRCAHVFLMTEGGSTVLKTCCRCELDKLERCTTSAPATAVRTPSSNSTNSCPA